MPVFFGTAANETITPAFVSPTVTRVPAGSFPGAGADVLLGRGGNDSLDGGAGNDVLDGGDGNDFLRGNLGADTLLGGDGIDTATYSESAAGVNVSLTTGLGFFGTAAGDQLFEIENLTGSSFADTLTGNALANTLNGLGGNDVLSGLGGIDLLLGGAGNDLLTGGDGNDRMFGEAGNDTMIWNPGDDSDLMEGGTGTDTAVVNGGGAAETFTIEANGARVRFDRVSPDPFSLDIGTTERLVVHGNGGDDVITADTGLATLINLTLDGGDGNDSITGGDGNDTLLGGDGNDEVSGERGNDIAFLGAGNDTFEWDPGDGSDIVQGQAGIDTLEFDGADVAENIDISANGTHARFFRDVGTITMDLNDVERIRFNALGDADNIVVHDLSATDVDQVLLDLSSPAGSGVGDGAADTVRVDGTPGNDAVTVSSIGASVAVSGLAATVTIRGAEGANDSLTVNGFAGNDTINASGLNAGQINLTIDGGVGNDSLIGSAGNDTLAGGTGDDSLDGRAGNDALDGGDGNDFLRGNTGADALVGGAGVDTASYTESAAGVNVSLATGLGFGGSAAGDTLSGIENLNGSNFADTLVGNALANTLNGFGGDDRLWGLSGNDTLNGGTGNDTLIGGLGRDAMTGGGGFDTFDFNSVNESLPGVFTRDTVADFVGNGAFAGDRIDVSTIDANVLLAGNQAFTFIGGAAFSAPGQLRYAGGLLQGSTDLDAAPEFEVALTGAPALTVFDITL